LDTPVTDNDDSDVEAWNHDQVLAPSVTAYDRVLAGAYARQNLPPLYRRTWLLALLAHCDAYGLTPVPGDFVHGIALLASTLSDVYEVPAPDRFVLKSADTPFFPGIQWDLDRLRVAGLIAASGQDRDRLFCTSRGRELMQLAHASPLFRTAEEFLKELVAAVAGFPDLNAATIARADAVYSTPGPTGKVLDYGEWDDPDRSNFTYRTTLAFESVLEGKGGFAPRDRLHLYARYLGCAHLGAA